MRESKPLKDTGTISKSLLFQEGNKKVSIYGRAKFELNINLVYVYNGCNSCSFTTCVSRREVGNFLLCFLPISLFLKEGV